MRDTLAICYMGATLLLLYACSKSSLEDSHSNLLIGNCQIEMHDNFNEFEVNLQLENIQRFHFIVTDAVDTEYAWSVDVLILNNGMIDFDAGVSQIYYEDLMHNYAMVDNENLTFTTIDGHPCSEFEEALI